MLCVHILYIIFCISNTLFGLHQPYLVTIFCLDLITQLHFYALLCITCPFSMSYFAIIASSNFQNIHLHKLWAGTCFHSVFWLAIMNLYFSARMWCIYIALYLWKYIFVVEILPSRYSPQISHITRYWLLRRWPSVDRKRLLLDSYKLVTSFPNSFAFSCRRLPCCYHGRPHYVFLDWRLRPSSRC